MVNLSNEELLQNHILVSTFYKRPVQLCVSNLLHITSNHCCANETFTCSSTATQFGKSPTIAHVNIAPHIQWRRTDPTYSVC